MSEALDLCAPATHPRLCIDCGHIHGIFAYGLCMEQVGGGICPCTELRTGRPRHGDPSGGVSERSLVRRAARMFAELSPVERARYETWAGRWADSDLMLHEFAVGAGIDHRLLWRTWRSLRRD